MKLALFISFISKALTICFIFRKNVSRVADLIEHAEDNKDHLKLKLQEMKGIYINLIDS